MSRKDTHQQIRLALGQALERYRVQHNVKQKEMAELLAIDERTLRRWESGDVSQRVDDLIRIAEVLGVDYEQLGLSSSVYIPRTPEQIDAGIEQIWSLIHQARYAEGRAFVEKLLRDISLQVTTEDSVLLTRLARVHHVAGHVTSEGSRTESIQAALQHFHEVEEVARLINDQTLLNIGLTYQGDMLRRQGNIQKAIEYLEAARDTAPLADMEARGNGLQLLGRAYLGKMDLNGFERAMAQAEEASSNPFTGSTHGFYSLGAVYEEYAKSYGWMGRTEKAMDYLDLAEKHLPSTMHWKIVLMTARAMTLVHGNDITNGGELAIEAARYCYQTGNFRMLERVIAIQRYLEQLTREVGHLTGQLREALSGSIEPL